ncbi:MAG TPA: TVP38/TMEM64 family protein [Verrucomicrobiae bacterium]|nr:TVP38/TMEM64 family protein [Verrucomicrobiae bacterium]
MNEITADPQMLAASVKKPGLPLVKIALALIVVAGLVLFGRRAAAFLPQFAAWVNGLGVWGPVVFIAGYALAAVAFVPGSILTLAAGAIFGLGWGTLYVYIAATIGSSAAFLVSRHLARAVIEKKIAGNVRFASIDRAVGAQGKKLVFLLRLSPIFPFNLLNYALGLTKVAFTDYVVASVGMIPGTILYVYYGKLAGDVAALASGAAVQKGAGYYAVLGLGLLATVVVTTLVTRTAQKALKEATEK